MPADVVLGTAVVTTDTASGTVTIEFDPPDTQFVWVTRAVWDRLASEAIVNVLDVLRGRNFPW